MPAADLHPTRAELHAFAVGVLDESAARSVESHLAECPACLAQAASAPDDTLVTLLRTAETTQAGPVTPQPAFAETIGLPEADTAVAPTPGPPELINHSRYRIIRPLGRGGMGHVWLAEHTVMGRPVALKLIRPEFLDKAEAVERFRREVRAAAKLNHPNIVAAHDAEQAGGSHFLVMEYIDGETLLERIERGPVPVDDACRWVIDAARGLDHARSNGLIHRDVKPHNLIRERASGRVKVLDFGLAGVTAGETSGLTGGNMVIGTPDYIAPEQAEDARTADTRSDVYALGCTLYHLLAGRPPFPGDAVLKKLDAHRTKEPDPLTAVRPEVPAKLVAIVAKMMAKDPARRYQTPGEVAEALVSHIEPDRTGSVSDRNACLRPLTLPAFRGRTVAIAAGLAVCVAILVGGVVYRIQTDRGEIVITPHSPDVQIVLLKDGKEVQVIDTKTDKKVTIPVGDYDWKLKGESDGLTVASEKIVVRRGQETLVDIQRVAPRAPGPVVLHGKPNAPFTELIPFIDPSLDREAGSLGSFSQAYLQLASDAKNPARFSLPFRPEGDYEFRARVTRMSGEGSINMMLPIPGTDGGTQVGVLLDALREPDDAVATLDWPNGPTTYLAKTAIRRLSPGKTYLVLARVTMADPRVKIQLVVNGESILEWTGRTDTARNSSSAFTKNRRQLGIGASDSKFQIERLEARMLSGTGVMSRSESTGDRPSVADKPGQARKFGRYKGTVGNLVLTPDGTQLYVADAGLSKWNVGTGTMVWETDEPGAAVAALSGDGKVLTTWGEDGTARVLDPATGEVVRKFPVPREEIGHAILNKDGTRAWISNRGNEKKGVKPVIRVWDVTDGKELFQLVGHTDNTYGIALSPGGTSVATASYDSTVRLWDAATGKERHLFRGHDGAVSAVAFSPDGKYLATGGGDQAVRIWNVEEKRGASVLTGHGVWITDVAFTPDGSRVVSVSGYEAKGDGARVWDWRAGTQLHHYSDVRGRLTGLVITPDGRHAIAAGDDEAVRVWPLPAPVPSGPERVGPIRRFGRFQGGTSAIDLSKDGKYLYSIDTGVLKWDWAAEKVVWMNELGADGANHLAASRDDRHVLVALADGTVRVLDAATGKELRRFAKHRERALYVAIAPDGKRAVSSSGDKKGSKQSIRVWDIYTLKELFELKGHTDETWHVAFSPDGTRIATASDDGTVRLWDASNGNELHVFRGHKGAASAVAFSPDGKRLASGGQDMYVRVWDVEKKGQVYAREGHDVWITEVAFTPDGTRILSVSSHWEQESSDGLRVWDAATGKPLYEGAGPGVLSVGVAPVPDNRYAITGGMDGAIRVWRLPDAAGTDPK